MAKFAFIQNRLGRTDGVSLEVDKWRLVLEQRLGHEVVYCAGNPDVPGYHLPEIFAQHPTTWKILRNGTVAFTDYEHESDLEAEIYAHADVIEARLEAFIAAEKPDVLVPNNLCSVGYQPAAAIALHRVIRRSGLPTIVHSHDFFFEESGEVEATCAVVRTIFERYLPPTLPNVQHVVINRLAQQAIAARRSVASLVVPNVFDFEQPQWRIDDYNADWRQTIGIEPDDLVVLQATRILDRKGIELAIDVVAQLEQPARRSRLSGMALAGGGRFGPTSRIILLCAGIVETIGISGGYWAALQARAHRLGVDLRHVGDRVAHSRGQSVDGSKVYSLWDTYVQADFVTYPSTWEGWGNQFIEAVFARLPLVIFEYPVWQTDLGPEGFEVISLGGEICGRDADGLVVVNEASVVSAVESLVELLISPERRNAVVDRNWAIANARFSLSALEALIRFLLRQAGIPEATR